MSSAGAVSAGTASTTRNAATPARMTRMRMPAPLATPAKTRSPGRRTARPVPGGDGGVVLVLLTVAPWCVGRGLRTRRGGVREPARSEEHTSELQSRQYLVCRLLLA